jgi:hypothetical protein
MRGVLILAVGLLCAPMAAAQMQQLATVTFDNEISAFEMADRRASPEPCQVLFIGSSTMLNWSTLASDLAPRGVIARGYSNATLDDLNRTFPSAVARYRPAAIVLNIGEDDISAGQSTTEIMGAFAEFMALKMRALGDTPVFFMSIKPSRLHVDQLFEQGEVNGAVGNMARRRRDLIYVNVASPMLHNGIVRDLFADDGVTMTGEGYAIWAARINDALTRSPARAPGCPREGGRAAD